MKKLLQRMVRGLWGILPEGQYKEKVRVLRYNYISRGIAHFNLRKGIYSTQIGSLAFRTVDHPFGVVQEHYQAKYKVKAGDIVIDAGAYHGHLSLLFALEAGPSGRLVAIEPDEMNLNLMERNLLLNPTIHIINMVDDILWDSSGEVEFSEGGGVCSSAFYKPASRAVVLKKAVTLDDLIRNLSLPTVNFIKMDIEGAEVKALSGAVDCLERFQPELAIATYHMIDGVQTRPAVECFLRRYNYNVETISYGRECITYGSPKSTNSTNQ